MYPTQPVNPAVSQGDSNPQTGTQPQQQNPQGPHIPPRISIDQLNQFPPPLVESICKTPEKTPQNGKNSGVYSLTDMQRAEQDAGLNSTEVSEEENIIPKIKVKKKRKLVDLLSEGINRTKLEENSDQVRDRLKKICKCESDNCFKNMNPEFVFRHRLNIERLTKNEHDMYLMGVTMACLANPEETSRHKERKRLRASYVFQGKKVCLDAFLYLENCTHHQLKAIRKHVMVNDVTPRVHGNDDRKPPNTFLLSTYQHAKAFLHTYIARYSPNNNVPPKTSKSGESPPVNLPADITFTKIHNVYKEYCKHTQLDFKVMGYSSFRSFMKEQFPNVKKSFRIDKKNERILRQSDKDDESINNPLSQQPNQDIGTTKEKRMVSSKLRSKRLNKKKKHHPNIRKYSPMKLRSSRSYTT